MINNVTTIVKSGLCMSCGICLATCKCKAIRFVNNSVKYYPIVDNKLCINCGLCIRVCPGKGINLTEQSQMFSGAMSKAGKVLSSYVGYSTNEDIRYYSSSGGALSSFICYLFDIQYIDSAIVVDFDAVGKKSVPFIAHNKEDVIKAKGSKYVITPYGNVIKELRENKDEKSIIVGLPCQIQGLRLLVKHDKKLRDKIVGMFSLYCSINKTSLSIDYYYKRNRISPLFMSFRTDGCLGNMKMDDGKMIKKIPYIQYWHGTHSFFCNDRCALCHDHFGELADISFGDMYVTPYNKDRIGVNSIVVRSDIWNNMWNRAINDGYLKMEKKSISSILMSQKYCSSYKKGPGLQGALRIRRIFFKQIPDNEYISDYHVPFIWYLRILIGSCMRFIGKHRFMFWLISFLDNSKAETIIKGKEE